MSVFPVSVSAACVCVYDRIKLLYFRDSVSIRLQTAGFFFFRLGSSFRVTQRITSGTRRERSTRIDNSVNVDHRTIRSDRSLSRNALEDLFFSSGTLFVASLSSTTGHATKSI